MTVPILIATLRGADYMNFDMGKIYMMIMVAIVPIIVVYLLSFQVHHCRHHAGRCKGISFLQFLLLLQYTRLGKPPWSTAMAAFLHRLHFYTEVTYDIRAYLQRHTHPGALPRELEHGRLARRARAGGIVLLKNTGTLPLDLSGPVALFGSGASRTVKGGIGSGDVNNRANVSICQRLKDAGLRLTSENWLEDYEARYHAARAAWKQKVLEAARWVENPFDAYAANPFVLPQGRPIVPQDVQEPQRRSMS